MATAFITGAAGFIGFFAAKQLLQYGYRVVGLDCMSDYYDVGLKEARLALLKQSHDYRHVFGKVEDPGKLLSIFKEEHPDVVIHLAAQAGVRYSIQNPRAYLESNLIGTFELLEAARLFPPRHMLLASTSSAYGTSTDLPFKETQRADHQVSFYAATKKSTETMAHSYAHLFNLPITMFRFFTVYGPWGRPDMAPFIFTKAILAGEAIDVYNYGNMKRDFTYVEDLVKAICLLIDVVPQKPLDGVVIEGDSLSPVAPWRVVNIGNSNTVNLTKFIEIIEETTGLKAICNLMPMQAGDVAATWADASLLQTLTGYQPSTSVQDGMRQFVKWYQSYYGVSG